MARRTSSTMQRMARTMAAPLRWLRASLGNTDLARWMRIAQSVGDDVNQPLAQVAAVYSGVQAIAKTVGGMPGFLYRDKPENRVERGPAYELLHNPGGHDDLGAMVTAWTGHMVEGGEAHVLFGRGQASGKIRALEVVGRRQMDPILDPITGRVALWRYRPLGGTRQQTLLPNEDEAGSKLFNPYDPNRGLGPLAAAALGVRQDYKAALYNLTALANGSAPGGMLVFPERVTDEEAREIMATFRARHAGPEKANELLVIGGGVDYKQTAWKNTDLDLLEGRRFNREEIFNALGVPSVIVAIYESAHYDVADKSIEIFITFTVMPLATAFMNLMNKRVLPLIEPGVQFMLDPSGHPVLQRLAWSKLDVLRKSIESGVPYNEATAWLGLPFAKQKWGDQSLLASGLTTAEDVIAGMNAPPEVGPTGNSDGATKRRSDEGAERRRDEETERRSDEGAETAAAKSERRFDEALTRAAMPMIRNMFRAHWARQERKIVARLRKAEATKRRREEETKRRSDGATKGKAQTAADAPSAEEIQSIIQKVLLDLGEEMSTLRKLVRAYFPSAAEKAIRAELERLGMEAEKIDAIVADIKRGRPFKSTLRGKEAKIGNVERVTRERLKTQLIEGLEKGETVQGLTDRVHSVLAGNRSRALTIARTEAGQATGTGRFLASVAAGTKAKAWLTGANPRSTHSAAGAKYAPGESAIAMSETFKVGRAELMYPRDPSGPAEEIINCNCVLIPQRAKPKSEDSQGAAA